MFNSYVLYKIYIFVTEELLEFEKNKYAKIQTSSSRK